MANRIYVTLIVRNNKTGLREEIVVKYFDYCFIEDDIAKFLKDKYELETKKGYQFYEDDVKCSKVYFRSTSEMEKIISNEKITRANLRYLKPDRKFLLDKNIRYKLIINSDERPVEPDQIFPLDVDEIDKVQTIYCDIEVDSEGDLKFPTGDNAIHPVITISYECPNGDIIWTCLDDTIEELQKEVSWNFKTVIENLKIKKEKKELLKEYLNHIKPEKQNIRVIFYKNESDMLRFVGEVQREYESYLLTGWNFLRFDMYYLIGRCKVLGIRKEVLAIQNYLRHSKTHDDTGRDIVKVWTSKSYIIDALEAFIKYYPENLKYNGLNDVASEVLGPKFKKLEMPFSIRKAFKKDRKMLMVYNVIDSVLVRMIDEKIRLFTFYELRRKKRGLTIADVFAQIKPIEASLLYFAEESNVALPNHHIKERTVKLKGADVFTEKATIFPFAFMVDFRSEYPSIAASLNCSRRTLVKDEVLRNKLATAYKSYKKGGYKKLPMILKGFTVAPGQGKLIFFDNTYDCFEKKFLMRGMKQREKYANIANQYDFDSIEYMIYHAYEQNEKLDGNALYGSWANKYFLLGEIQCGQAITSVGRALLAHQRKFIFSLGHRVAISDTDSADFGLEIDDLTKEEAVKKGYEVEKVLAKEMNQYVKKILLFGSKNGYMEGFEYEDDNTNTQWIFAKFEKLFSPMITTGKKKYYCYKEIWRDGRFLKVPKYIVKGLPCIKRDASPIFRDAQFGLIKHLLDEKMEFKPKVEKFIKNFRKKMETSPIDYLATTGAYKTEVTEYKAVQKGNLPPHHASAMCNSMANFGITFEPISRFKIIRVNRIKGGKYNKESILINGINVKFQNHSIAFNEIDDLPSDFLDYFKPDYDHLYYEVIIKKCEVFFKMLGIDQVVFKGQKQMSDFW